MSTETRFMVITPGNDFTRHALLQTANRVGQGPSYHGRFISVNNESQGRLKEHPPPSPVTTDLKANQLAGLSASFVLAFDQNPGGVNGGWRLGPGFRTTRSDRGVDLLLEADGLAAPVVAVIFPNPTSGVLMLQATSEIYHIDYLGGLGGGGDLRMKVGDKAVLWQRQNRIRFGEGPQKLELLLRFTAGSSTTNRDDFLLRVCGNDHPTPSKFLDPFPTQRHQWRCGHILHHHNIFGTGTFGRVSAGVDATTGEPVAIKEIRTKMPYDMKAVEEEYRINMHLWQAIRRLEQPRNRGNQLSRVQQQTRYHLSLFTSAWCRHTDTGPPEFSNAVDDFTFAAPLAEGSIHNFLRNKGRSNDRGWRKQLFHGAAKGLNFLHKNGVMHRDVTISNIFVTRDDNASPPWVALVGDLGKAIMEERDRQIGIGPRATLAPEVIRCGNSGYTNAIDVWAFAIAYIGTFSRDILPTDWIDEGSYKRLMDGLKRKKDERSITPAEYRILREMLHWSPTNRPTMEQIVADPFWTTDS